jgi:hypothetical protein
MCGAALVFGTRPKLRAHKKADTETKRSILYGVLLGQWVTMARVRLGFFGIQLTAKKNTTLPANHND